METQETRINNGVNEIKTDKFIYKHKSFGSYPDTVFDLYTDFEKFKTHIIKFYEYGVPRSKLDKYVKDIKNTTLKSDEYFIGVMLSQIRDGVYSKTTGDGSNICNFIFYTNYGNIIDISISPLRGFEPFRNYIVIKNNRKLNLEQINLLNFIIQPDKYEINCAHVSSSYINAIINRVIYNYNESKHEEPKREEPKREEPKREEPKRENEEAERKEICKKYITFLKSKGIKDGPTMVRWQRGKDRSSDEFKKVVKAYKYVHQDNKCPDFKKDGNKSRKRKSKSRKKKSKSRKRKNFK